MKRYAWLLLITVLAACTGGDKKEKENSLDGVWEASWQTDPASYEGISGITDFTMNGKFIFQGEKLNIKAFGFEGCVFNRDTLNHVLNWKISGDSLILINEDAVPGMVYQIKSSTENELKLQLMEDIFLTLNRN